jgi:hypothetical protein
MNNRYRVIETTKTFAGKFNRRVQKSGENAEEYAAELKRLYDKAYPRRDRDTRREDLVRRFIDGLLDDDARFNVEYHKEPTDIDEAVYYVVIFIQTKSNGAYGRGGDRRNRRGTRVAREDTNCSKEEAQDNDYVCRIPQQRREIEAGVDVPKAEEKAKFEKDLDEVKRETKEQAKTLKEIQEQLLKLIEGRQRKQPRNRENITCYSCGEKGHYSGECKKKQSNKNSSNAGKRRQETNTEERGCTGEKAQQQPLN